MSRIEGFDEARPPSTEAPRAPADARHPARRRPNDPGHAREDRPTGPRPPEPLLSASSQKPERPAERSASLATAAVLYLERMPTTERAVFVLRRVFGCDAPRIASVLGGPEAACHRSPAAPPAPGDTDGDAPPWPEHIAGPDHVARALAAIVPALARIGVTMQPQDTAGGPGAVFRDRNGTVLGALALDILDGRIQTVRWMTGPAGPTRPGDEGDAE